MRVSKHKNKTSQKATSAKPPSTGQSSFGSNYDVNAILQAQRTVGNQSVAQVLNAQAIQRGPMHLTVPSVESDTRNSAVRQRIISTKQYKMYLNEIVYHNPDSRFTNTVKSKWLRILKAYCNGYLTDTKYMTLSDMKYGKTSDFVTTIKNMLDITWQRGDDPTILAQKLNRLDDALNAAKGVVKKMTEPTSFLRRRNVILFHEKRHNDGSSFLDAGSWSYAFSWKKWLGF